MADQPTLYAIINACSNAITPLSNYVQTLSDPNEISICLQAMQGLHTISTEATQALQAENDEVYKQEVTSLKNAASQIQNQTQTLKQVIQVGGVVLQIVNAILQVAALIALL